MCIVQLCGVHLRSYCFLTSSFNGARFYRILRTRNYSQRLVNDLQQSRESVTVDNFEVTFLTVDQKRSSPLTLKNTFPGPLDFVISSSETFASKCIHSS